MHAELLHQIKIWAITYLTPHLASEIDRTYITDLDADDLLVVVHNWHSRLIIPYPRRVRKSKTYLQNPVSQTPDLIALCSKIEGGSNLNPHLSKRIKNLINPKKKSVNSRPDIDHLLNIWGIHHLHISQEIGGDGFARRGDSLLFAVFKSDAAYLLDVKTHADFHTKHLLEIIARDFPNEKIIFEVKGVAGLSHEISDNDRSSLAKRGINSFAEINGKVFFPINGISSAGTSLRTTVDVADLLINTENLANQIKNNPVKFKTIASRCNKIWPSSPNFRFTVIATGQLVFWETATGIFFPVA